MDTFQYKPLSHVASRYQSKKDLGASRQSHEVAVSPNPFSGDLQVRLRSDQSTKATLILLSVDGRKLCNLGEYQSQSEWASNAITVDCLIGNGVYLMAIVFEDGFKIVEKLVFIKN